MQNNLNNIGKQYEDDLRSALEKVPFPSEHVCPSFRLLLAKALEHQNCKSIECDWPTYKRLSYLSQFPLADVPVETNLYDMSFAINAITYCTPRQMDIFDQSEYIQHGDNMEAMAKIWNGMVVPIKENVTRRLQVQQTIKRTK